MEAAPETKAKASSSNAEPKFGKAQLLNSEKYFHQRDLIAVLLEDDKLYTADEVEKLVKGYLTKKL